MYSPTGPYGALAHFDQMAPFADPFADLTSAVMPTSVPAMFRHAEYFSVTNETLREAYNRIAAYFITEIELEGDLGDDEKQKQKEYLIDRAGIVEFLQEAGLSLLTYGNQYTSVLMPFVRYIDCPRSGCAVRYRLSNFMADARCQFEWRNGFYGRCPACDYGGMFADKTRPPHDEPDESRPLILQSWNQHDIRIRYNEATRQSTAFDWIIPADFRTDVRAGYNHSVLAETPWEWIVACLDDKNVRFDPKYIHHWKEPNLSGLRTRGVGVPRAITNYRQMYYVQILKRMNEALALGHVVPFRVISPANTPGRGEEGDILKTAYLGDMRSRVMAMWAAHRQDPNAVHFSPIPLQLQALGADARQLIPQDILNQAQEILLNGCGVPVNFYRGDMTIQAAPVGLRLINRIWAPFIFGLNRLLNFIGEKAQFYLAWEKAKYKLAEVSLIDDVEKNTLLVQMAQAGLLSRTDALKTVNKDFKQQTRQKLEDQRTEMMEQSKFEEEQDSFSFSRQLSQATPAPGMMQGAMGPGGSGQPQQGGQPAGPGQPQPGAGSAPGGGVQPGGDPAQGLMQLIPDAGAKIDPQELLSRATSAAQALLTVSESQRFGLMKQIKSVNSFFHAIVKSQLEQTRSKARSQGQQAVLQQQFGTS